MGAKMGHLEEKDTAGLKLGNLPEPAKPRLTWTNLEPHVSHL